MTEQPDSGKKEKGLQRFAKESLEASTGPTPDKKPKIPPSEK